MTKKNSGEKTSRRGVINEGCVKKGSVGKPPSTSRPSKPTGQGGSTSGSEKKQ